MSNFKRKPDTKIYTPEQYNGEKVTGMCDKEHCFVAHIPHVHTTHQNQVAKLEIGDWVMPEPNGNGFYPIKPDIFEATYEPVE